MCCDSKQYCIYTIDPRTTWIKVGYGDQNRPGSSDYFTGFGIDPDVSIWKFNISKDCCYDIEQGIHTYIKQNNVEVGTAGTECYISSKKEIHKLIEEFFKKENLLFQRNDTTVVNYRKTMKKKIIDVKDFTLVDHSKITEQIICDICGRKCTKDPYECIVLDKENNEQIIYTGPTCFAELNNGKKTIEQQQWIYDKISGKEYNPVDQFISDYQRDSSNIWLPKIDYPIMNMECRNVGPLLIRYFLHYLFKPPKKEVSRFKGVITQEILTHYELNIDIIDAYYMFCPCLYFETDFDSDKNEFTIIFTHPTINKTTLSKFFCGLRTKPFTYSKALDNISTPLDETQQSYLNSHNPFIAGVPGSGKSQIIKYILTTHPNKTILLITPTYASLDLLMTTIDKQNKLVKEKNNVIGMVIDSWNEYKIHKKLDIKDDDDKDICLIVDEIYMCNILHMYKLQQIIEKYNIKQFKFFGDPFQLPPIGFKDETRHIHSDLHNKSMVLSINYRAYEYPKEVTFLNDNKTDYKDLYSLSKVFETQKYSEEIIEKRLTEVKTLQKDHFFIASMNVTVNQINNICYNIKKKEWCDQCENNITIESYKFCKNCIGKFEFLCSTNKKFDTILKCKKHEYKEKQIVLKENLEYSNRVMVSEINGSIKYIRTQKQADYMFFNGQKLTIKPNEFEGYDIKANKDLFYMKKEDINTLNLSLMFAITVHKSQGRSVHNITFIIDKDNLDSDVIFTALTRARNPQQILILNKLDKDDINFNNIPYYLSEESMCKTIYKSQKPNDPFSGKTYKDVFIEKTKNNPDWIDFMVSEQCRARRHRDIFKICQKLYSNIV
jgi:hypothetical protein